MSESDSDSRESEPLRDLPLGWDRVDGAGDPANIFHLDIDRPDFPEPWRAQHEARDRAALDADAGFQAEVVALRQEWAGNQWERISEYVTRGSEIRNHTGNEEIIKGAGMLLDHISSKIRIAAELAPAGVSPVTAIRYIAERTVPPEILYYVTHADETASPIDIVVNASTNKRLHVVISPGEGMIRFRKISRRDVERVGPFITEATQILGGQDSAGKGGRPRSGQGAAQMETPVLAARLYHWDRWSQRRIAAFFGWLKPSDDWSNPKVRTRIEQRVRRWIRDGEKELTQQTGNDDWKNAPMHYQNATTEKRSRE